MIIKERYKDKWKVTDAPVVEFGLDGSDYHLLEQAAFLINNIEGLTLEIGTREGGSSRIIIDGIVKSGPYRTRTHVCLDPYGGIEYEYCDDYTIVDAYPNRYRDVAIPALFKYCTDKPINLIYYQMTDEQFFKRFADGVPVYLDGKETIENKYALVFFDGPHTTELVLRETEFFEERASQGAMFVYDNVQNYYDHSKIENYLASKGWTLLGASVYKAVYVKE